MLRAVERVFLWKVPPPMCALASMVVASHEEKRCYGAWMVAGLTAQAADLSTVLTVTSMKRGVWPIRLRPPTRKLEAVVTAWRRRPFLRTGRERWLLDQCLQRAHGGRWRIIGRSNRSRSGWGQSLGRPSFTVAGKSVTLNDIELNPAPMGDLRIHAAVNYAAWGARHRHHRLHGDRARRRADAASRRWAQSTGATIDRKTGVVSLSKIFDWYGDDFVAGATGDIPGVDERDATSVLARHLPTEDAGWVIAGGIRCDGRLFLKSTPGRHGVAQNREGDAGTSDACAQSRRRRRRLRCGRSPPRRSPPRRSPPRRSPRQVQLFAGFLQCTDRVCAARGHATLAFPHEESTQCGSEKHIPIRTRLEGACRAGIPRKPWSWWLRG